MPIGANQGKSGPIRTNQANQDKQAQRAGHARPAVHAACRPVVVRQGGADAEAEAELIRKIQDMPVEAVARLTPTQRAMYETVMQQQRHQGTSPQSNVSQSPGSAQSSHRNGRMPAQGRCDGSPLVADARARTAAEADLIRKIQEMPVEALTRLTPRQRAMYDTVLQLQQAR